MNCPICQAELVPSHPFKVHKIKLENFMYQYFPKKDLYSNEQIVWKGDVDNYLLKDFNSKNNLKNWLKNQTIEKQKEYLKEVLAERKEIKGLRFVPTQVECRSYDCFPGIIKFNELFENYYDLCAELGFESRRFINLDKKSIIKKERDLRGNPILVDSREQNLLNWNNKEIKICALSVGDYSVEKDNYDIFIERKSLQDLCSTFGPKNFDRFRRELIRAQESGAYLILLVENDFNTVLGFDHSPFYSKHTQMTATFLFHQIRILLQEFKNWQIAFCKSRTDMVEKIKFIFELGKRAENYDYQLLFDLKLFENTI